MRPLLILLPNLLDENQKVEDFLPPAVAKSVQLLNGLICESEKEGRRYLRRYLSHEKMAQMPLALYNEHTQEKDLPNLIAPILQNQVWGLISDLGLPCLADPGAKLVLLAKKAGIEVQGILGPSAVVLALMLSGLEGQRFAFHGYLPKEEKEAIMKIRELEKRSKAENATQFWIEAPYRSQRMLELLKKTLHPKTLLCAAKNISLPNQEIITQPVEIWQTSSFAIGKEPTIFLIY